MKKIFTLYAAVVSLLLSNTLSAQINENFDKGFDVLEANCWEFPSMQYATAPAGFVINGDGSPYSEPPVNSSSVRIMRTPFLYVGSTISVSFLYKLSSSLNGAAARFISIELVDPSGTTVQSLATISISNTSAGTISYNQTFAVHVPAAYRLAITIGGNNGDGNTRLSIDDLTVDSYNLGCDPNAVPLPVHLMSFQGNMNKNNKVTLNWAVADNETVQSFEVERSSNGRDFTTVGVVLASEKMGTENYMFYETVNSGEKIMYRLKMIDKGHDIDYSKTLIFNLKSVSNNIKIIGNPVNDKLTFSLAASSTQPVSIKVYEMSGKLVMENKVNISEGNNTMSLPLATTFKPGMYVVAINNGTESQTAKFIKQ